jgi:hypothetical protein
MNYEEHQTHPHLFIYLPIRRSGYSELSQRFVGFPATAGPPMLIQKLQAMFERMTLVSVNSANGQTNKETLYVEKTALLDRDDLKNTYVVTDTLTKRPEIAFELSAAGQKRFAEITRKNIGKRLALIIDGQVSSAPVIRSEITGGKGQIFGEFHPEASEGTQRQNQRRTKEMRRLNHPASVNGAVSGSVPCRKIQSRRA